MKFYIQSVKKYIQKIIPLLKKTKDIFFKYTLYFLSFLKKSWRSVIVFTPMFLIVYYTVGAFLSHKVDTNLHFSTQNTKKEFNLLF